MKTLKNYILVVDGRRRVERRRNTCGRYRVGARTQKEAISLLRNKIKFGSIQFLYECDADDTTIGYKQIEKEYPKDGIVRSATDPIRK